MYDYWNARSLEQEGQGDRARDIFSDLASSTATNYYPAIAARRVGEPPIDLPAAAWIRPGRPRRRPDARRSICNAPWRSKRSRLIVWNWASCGVCSELTEDSRTMRLFLLAEFPQAGGYHDAT